LLSRIAASEKEIEQEMSARCISQRRVNPETIRLQAVDGFNRGQKKSAGRLIILFNRTIGEIPGSLLRAGTGQAGRIRSEKQRRGASNSQAENAGENYYLNCQCLGIGRKI
jgi:hypothetical protein